MDELPIYNQATQQTPQQAIQQATHQVGSKFGGIGDKYRNKIIIAIFIFVVVFYLVNKNYISNNWLWVAVPGFSVSVILLLLILYGQYTIHGYTLGLL